MHDVETVWTETYEQNGGRWVETYVRAQCRTCGWHGNEVPSEYSADADDQAQWHCDDN